MSEHHDKAFDEAIASVTNKGLTRRNEAARRLFDAGVAAELARCVAYLDAKAEGWEALSRAHQTIGNLGAAQNCEMRAMELRLAARNITKPQE